MRKEKERQSDISKSVWDMRKKLWPVYKDLRNKNEVAVSFREFLKYFKLK